MSAQLVREARCPECGTVFEVPFYRTEIVRATCPACCAAFLVNRQ